MTRIPQSRWLAPGLLAAGLLAAAIAPAPAQAQSQDELVRVIVDVADRVLRGDPSYRHGPPSVYDHRGRTVYHYRTAPRPYPRDTVRHDRYGPLPGYGWRTQAQAPRARCDDRGRCVVRYHDPRQDRSRDRRGR